MNIVELFLSAANKHPNKIAIIEKGKEISFAQLQVKVQTTAAYFQKRGLKKGDRVLVFVPMGSDLYRVVLALFYMGATAVFLDEWVSKKRMEQYCRGASCKGLVGTSKLRFFSLFSKELRRIPVKLSTKKYANKINPITAVSPSESALITFTTGSTGTPKAANRTHLFLQQQFNALSDIVEPKDTTIAMPVLPIVLFFNLGVGCTSVIADFNASKPRTINITKILHQIQQHQVNRISASPFFVKKLAESTLEKNTPLSSVEKIFTGGAPVFPSEAKQYQKAFPKTSSTIIYGSTEAEPISTISAEKLSQRETSLSRGLPVGKPYKKIKVKIIPISESVSPTLEKEALESLSLKQKEIGEIIVSGAHVLKQYFNNEEAFKQNKIVTGKIIWHRTGDSGFLKDGELFLTGRCKQLIQDNSSWFSPFVVENQLQRIKDVRLGTIIKVNEQLILVVETSLKKEQLLDKLSHFRFDKLKIVSKIPRDLRHNSKIDYEKLTRYIA